MQLPYKKRHDIEANARIVAAALGWRDWKISQPEPGRFTVEYFGQDGKAMRCVRPCNATALQAWMAGAAMVASQMMARVRALEDAAKEENAKTFQGVDNQALVGEVVRRVCQEGNLEVAALTRELCDHEAIQYDYTTLLEGVARECSIDQVFGGTDDLDNLRDEIRDEVMQDGVARLAQRIAYAKPCEVPDLQAELRHEMRETLACHGPFQLML
jgi:hypothetical protein